jgi:hypothetical protein
VQSTVKGGMTHHCRDLLHCLLGRLVFRGHREELSHVSDSRVLSYRVMFFARRLDWPWILKAESKLDSGTVDSDISGLPTHVTCISYRLSRAAVFGPCLRFLLPQARHMSDMLNLNCWLLGDNPRRVFPVKIAKSETVGGLKEAIKGPSSKGDFNNGIDAKYLDLWKVRDWCFASDTLLLTISYSERSRST